MMIRYSPKSSVKKKIIFSLVFLLTLLGIYTFFSFLNTPLYLAKFRESYSSFWDTWSNKGYYGKYLELKSEQNSIENASNIKVLEESDTQKIKQQCLSQDLCKVVSLVQIFDYTSPQKLIVRGDSGLEIGDFVGSGVNFVGEITKKNQDGTYEIETIFNENKKYSVINLKQTAFGYSDYINSSIMLNPLSIEDKFADQDIIMMHEYGTKIVPQNLILGKAKLLGNLMYIENFLDFHFITELEVYK